MKNWIKKIGLGIGLSLLFSCGSPSSISQGEEIEFWTMQLQPKFTPYFEKLITIFEADNPGVTVKWVDVPWAAMESKIITAVQGKTAPDIVNLNPNFASQLATQNAWLNLNEQVSAEAKEQYLANIWKASTLGEQSFGIPWYLTTRVTIYNQDLLTQGGVAQPPKTYTELAEVAQQIKEKTGKYAFFVTFVPNDSGEVLESLVQMGVQLLDEQGQAAFNSTQGRAAFQYWVDLYQKELLPPEVLTKGHRYGIELYQAGETALLFSGAEFLNEIATNAPEVAKISASTLQITGKTGKKNVAVMNLVIPQDTDNPEEAVKFALFVTNTENQLAFAQDANVLPSTTQAIEQYIQELGAKDEGTKLQQARKVSASQLQDAEVLVPATANLNRLQKLIYENLQAAMLGQKTVEEALQDAETAWNQINR